jgi:hypothetical protein
MSRYRNSHRLRARKVDTVVAISGGSPAPGARVTRTSPEASRFAGSGHATRWMRRSDPAGRNHQHRLHNTRLAAHGRIAMRVRRLAMLLTSRHIVRPLRSQFALVPGPERGPGVFRRRLFEALAFKPSYQPHAGALRRGSPYYGSTPHIRTCIIPGAIPSHCLRVREGVRCTLPALCGPSFGISGQ